MNKNKVTLKASSLLSLFAIALFASFAGGDDSAGLSPNGSNEVASPILEQGLDRLKASEGEIVEALPLELRVQEKSLVEVTSKEVSAALAAMVEGDLPVSTKLAMVRAFAQQKDAPKYLLALTRQGQMPPPVERFVNEFFRFGFPNTLPINSAEGDSQESSSHTGGAEAEAPYPFSDELEDLLLRIMEYSVQAENEFVQWNHYGDVQYLEVQFGRGNELLSEMQALMERHPTLRFYQDEDGFLRRVPEKLIPLPSVRQFLEDEYWILAQMDGARNSRSMMTTWIPDWLRRVVAKFCAAVGIKEGWDSINDIAEESGLLKKLEKDLEKAGSSKRKKIKAVKKFAKKLYRTVTKNGGEALAKKIGKKKAGKILAKLAGKALPVIGQAWLCGSIIWACGEQLWSDDEEEEVECEEAFPTSFEE